MATPRTERSLLCLAGAAAPTTAVAQPQNHKLSRREASGGRMRPTKCTRGEHNAWHAHASWQRPKPPEGRVRQYIGSRVRKTGATSSLPRQPPAATCSCAWAGSPSGKERVEGTLEARYFLRSSRASPPCTGWGACHVDAGVWPIPRQGLPRARSEPRRRSARVGRWRSPRRVARTHGVAAGGSAAFPRGARRSSCTRVPRPTPTSPLSPPPPTTAIPGRQ
jgi:hypothetical protein